MEVPRNWGGGSPEKTPMRTLPISCASMSSARALPSQPNSPPAPLSRRTNLLSSCVQLISRILAGNLDTADTFSILFPSYLSDHLIVIIHHNCIKSKCFPHRLFGLPAISTKTARLWRADVLLHIPPVHLFGNLLCDALD